ncbi:MAG TPA: histidinol-phosphate transaminase [Candidatus Ozemobacteraceae bacterium]|nr:histidinol-phosphate transaminase [Candidatus Ozemobacteraceae bacterium]
MIHPRPVVENLHRTSQESRKGYLRLEMNECPDGLPADFVESCLREITPEFLATYPEYDELMALISRHEGLVSSGQIFLSNGSDSAIKHVFEAFVAPGDSILLANPCFAMYPVYAQLYQAKLIGVEYQPDLAFPTEAFLERMGKDVRLAVVVNPNNPCGSHVPSEALLQILTKAAQNGTLVIVDEAYHYFFPETAIPLIAKFPNLLVTRTFSKLCALAAARIGFAAGHPDIVGALRKVRPTYDVNGIGVLLAKRFLEQPDLIRKALLGVQQGRDWLASRLREKEIPFRTTDANFLLIDAGDRVTRIMQALRNEKVLVGGGFPYPFLKNYIRVSIAHKATMQAFWNIFERVWDEHARSH